MNKQIACSAVLGLALLNVCASVAAKPPSCIQPVGRWENVRGSVLEIRNYNAATGAVSGQCVIPIKPGVRPRGVPQGGNLFEPGGL